MFSRGRIGAGLAAAVLVTGVLAARDASAQQSVNFYLGGFVPQGEDSRGTNDELFVVKDFLTYDFGRFTGATVGGEWLLPVNYWIDAGFGLGYYQKTAPSFYTDLVNENGTDIEQDLKLRIVPFTATFRFLPMGRGAAVRPYVGAGIGVLSWRYSETGSFVDFDNTIFRDNFVAHGADVGPVFLGGVTVPIGRVDIGGEIRHQSGEGKLPVDRFYAPTINLGGTSYLAVFNIRF
jgi:hypothetical protein